jgi:hypothetical protein
VNDLRRNFRSAANAKFTEEVRNQNSGVRSCRSCRICEQGLYPKIRDRHLPGKISAGIPDSLAPELLQLLNSEFWNVESGTPSSFREVGGVQELQNETAACRSVDGD